MKKNNFEKYESIYVCLDPIKHPLAFEAKVKNLISSGISREDAEIVAREPIEMELYYEDHGLMMVESEAVETCEIYSPYTRELYEEYD